MACLSVIQLTSALKFLIGKRYVQEEIARYRITSEGEEAAARILNPLPPYDRLGVEAQRQNNRIALIAVVLTAVGIIITLFLAIAPRTPQQLALPSTNPNVVQVVEPQNPTMKLVRFFDFQACLQPCNGLNGTRSFRQRITEIFLQWKYENIPPKAHFVRTWTWTVNGKEWVRYDCTWPGPETGVMNVSLYDRDYGLPSGTWDLTIWINEQIVMHEQIVIEGNFDFWSPAEIPNGQCSGN